MAYQDNYRILLNAINGLIEKGEIEATNEALNKFKLHIKEVKNIGRFTIKSWNIEWRKAVYKFGEYFKSVDPIDFLNAITNEKEISNKDEKEVLDFYYSEIEFNSLSDNMCIEKYRNLLTEYPYNPEIHHTSGHFYKRSKQFDKAILHYRIAHTKDSTNQTFIASLFAAYYEFFESLIDNSEYEKGLDLCTKIINEGLFKANFFDNSYYLILTGLKDRFKDYLLLNKKIQEAEYKIKQVVSDETNKGRFKIIEILGFFTAIIAFIFSTVSIGKNFTFNEAIIFNITLGITLLTFVLMTNLFFADKEVKIFDIRIIMFVVLILSLILIITKFGVAI